MNVERFKELVGRLLDGDLSPADGDELAAALRAEPARRRELRQHLVLWELWSQRQATERSAEAFLAGCLTRLRAERQSESFLASLKKRIARDSGGESAPARRGVWWEALRRPAGFAWASSLAVAVALVVLVWMVVPQPAEAMTTVRGEAVCTLCVLHEGHVHTPAVRVSADGATHVYYLEATPQLDEMQGYFCSGPNPITVEGRPHLEDGRTLFSVGRIDRPPAPPKPTDDQRILFPL